MLVRIAFHLARSNFQPDVQLAYNHGQLFAGLCANCEACMPVRTSPDITSVFSTNSRRHQQCQCCQVQAQGCRHKVQEEAKGKHQLHTIRSQRCRAVRPVRCYAVRAVRRRSTKSLTQPSDISAPLRSAANLRLQSTRCT